MKKLIISFLLFFCFPTLFAQIIYVPDDYSMIQHAINDAVDGDVIIVREGTYCQQINFKGKAITVASEFFIDDDTSHISKTIIDGMFLPEKDSSSLVYFISGEDSTSVLSGFTLQNGKGNYAPKSSGDGYFVAGGAITMEYSGATITNNIIRNNKAVISIGNLSSWNGGWGGGIDCYGTPKGKTVIISNNIIMNNLNKSANQAMGGGVELIGIYGKVIISGNRIIGNKVESAKSGYGGGIAILGVSNDSDIIIENNYIAHNSTFAKGGSTKGGGIACYFSAPIIRNNIIVFNETKYPQLLTTNNAFGGGIAVFWYAEFTSEWPECEDPGSLITVIENNTIAFNNDKIAGGGIAFRSVGARLKNNIIGCNFAEDEDNQQIIAEYKGVPETESRTVKIEYCNIEGGSKGISRFYDGIGNIDEFPNYVDDEKWFLKRELSPCIDTGDPSKEYDDVPASNDIEKACFPALGSRRNDIGAFGGPNSKWHEIEIPTSVETKNDLVAKSIQLSQNYPNPFNPSTTIEYTIPSSSVIASGAKQSQKITSGTTYPLNDGGYVKLTVYDILGREVVTLVNEKQKPGEYEIIWDSSADRLSLTSGVYFYKLTVDDYSITKKLVLLK